MHKNLKDQLIRQIDEVIDYQKIMRGTTKHDDLSGVPQWEYRRFLTMALAAIQRTSGPNSVYSLQAKESIDSAEQGRRTLLIVFKTVLGIVESLRGALVSDYLEDTSAIIHASLFADFLEMSQHLLDEGYKDPAAVIAGSSLEAHLRQLCDKNGVDTSVTTTSGVGPKKADRINADLYSAKVYSGMDQKSVTAWLDLRNKAAHGHYTTYSAEQVALLISGIRDFITRNPA